jgi:dCTP deaminase
MAFWTSQMLARAGVGLVKPFNDDQVQSGAYELSMGGEAFVTQEKSEAKARLGEGEEVIIPSGQFALLLTEEWVAIPHDAIGLISVRSGLKFRGLVNVSGFHGPRPDSWCMTTTTTSSSSRL